MAAEWTYLVSKEPPQAAVVISDSAFSQAAALAAGEFTVTLCSAGQAALADFVGSVSGRDIDKTTSDLVTLREPLTISTPWIDGGVAALECQLTQVVELPGYQMLIGEVMETHADEARFGKPLVKHGGMYSLGAKLSPGVIVAAAEFLVGQNQRIRVAAAGHSPDESAVWRVLLTDGLGRSVLLGTAVPTVHGDLLASFAIPESARTWNLSATEILVERDGLEPGRARISFRRATPAGYPDSGRVPCDIVLDLRSAQPGPRKHEALTSQGGGVTHDAEQACP